MTDDRPEFTYMDRGADGPPVPTKVCRKCSVQTTTSGNFCPQCGASYIRRTRVSRKVALIGLAILLVVGAGAAGTLKVQNDREVRLEKVAAEKELAEKKEAQERERRAASAKAAADAAERTRRLGLVASLEESVLKDAREKATEGLLEGGFTEAVCTPLGGGSSDDLTAITGEFECIAVNKKNADGSSSGYAFSATINYDDDSWTWKLGR